MQTSSDFETKLHAVKQTVEKVVDCYHGDEEMLIQILLDLQNEFCWLPEEVLTEVARQLAVPLARIYRIATFYKAFSLAPKGRYVIKVCMGTACQVRGAPLVLSVMRHLLNITPGETTPDMKFSLETVNCVGCCPIAPVVLSGDRYHGSVRPAGVHDILNMYK